MWHTKLGQRQRENLGSPVLHYNQETSPLLDTSQGQWHFNLPQLFRFLNNLLKLNYYNTEQQI